MRFNFWDSNQIVTFGVFFFSGKGKKSWEAVEFFFLEFESHGLYSPFINLVFLFSKSLWSLAPCLSLRFVFFPGVKHSLRMLEVGNLNTEYLCLRSSLNLEIAKELSEKLLFHYSPCDLCLFFSLLLGLSQSRQQLTSFRGTKSTTTIAASNQFCCCWSGTSGGTCAQSVSQIYAIGDHWNFRCYINYIKFVHQFWGTDQSPWN